MKTILLALAAHGLHNPLMRACYSTGGDFVSIAVQSKPGDEVGFCVYQGLGGVAKMDALSIQNQTLEGLSSQAVVSYQGIKPGDKIDDCSSVAAQAIQCDENDHCDCQFFDGSWTDSETLKAGPGSARNQGLDQALAMHL